MSTTLCYFSFYLDFSCSFKKCRLWGRGGGEGERERHRDRDRGGESRKRESTCKSRDIREKEREQVEGYFFCTIYTVYGFAYDMPYIGVSLNCVMQVKGVSVLCVVAFGAQACSET